MYFENKMVVVQNPVLDRLWRYFVRYTFFIGLFNGAGDGYGLHKTPYGNKIAVSQKPAF